MIIVLFHAFYLLGKYVYENYYTCKEKTENTMSTNQLLNVSEANYGDASYTDEHVEKNINVKFFPPVYIQRYNTVQSILTSRKYHGKIHKVIDFGCAELTFAVHLKNTDGIQEIYCIDIDRSLLEKYHTKVAPLHCDYLSPRSDPLTINICEGSIAHSDNKLTNIDAVICIELIEHLYPDDLDAFPYNVFGFIKPLVAIVTTPNADFNVLFSLNGFRHYDHKFEWTRAQFQDWANNIILRYPDYEVSFDGIGIGPSGTEDLGSCSQMAVFHRHSPLDIHSRQGADNLLNTIVSYVYPYKTDIRSDEEKILSEVQYYISLFSARDEELSEEIPLEKLIFSVEKFCISIDTLRSILEEANWAIVDRENGPVVLVPAQSVFSANSDQDFDDFLDNDYRLRDSSDDWDALEPGAPSAGYFFDSYMSRDPQNHEEEENWNDEIYDTHRGSSVNPNNENLSNSEFHASENLDPTSDRQWTMEDLNNESPLSTLSQHHSNRTIHFFNTETELPNNLFLIESNHTATNTLNVFHDTLNSSNHDLLSSPLPLSDLSETLQSLRSNSKQSLSIERNSTIPLSNLKWYPQTQKNDTGICIKGSQNLSLDGLTSSTKSLQPVNSKNEVQHDDDHSKSDHEKPSMEFQTCCISSENDGQNCAVPADVHLVPNDYIKSLFENSSPKIEPAAPNDVCCYSLHNETSSVSTVEATLLLSNESNSLVDNKDQFLKDGQLLETKELVDNSSEGSKQSVHSIARICSTSALMTDQFMTQNDDDQSLCSLYLQPSSTDDHSLYPKHEISHLSIKDYSSAIDESYKNLDVPDDSLDSSYHKCETGLFNIHNKIESDITKSQDSISFKSISDCSLDLQPKYTSSPQIPISIHDIKAKNDNRKQEFANNSNLHNYNCVSTQNFHIKDSVNDCQQTYRSNIIDGIREALKNESFDPKINLVCTNDVSIRDQNTLPNEPSSQDEKIGGRNLNYPESTTVDDISPSTSQLSLQSNSDVSLIAATSTGSSNVDKWYAAEANPMYQRDAVVLKGGNDTADNQKEEPTSDSDGTISGSERGKHRKTTGNTAEVLPPNAGEKELGVTDKNMKTIQHTSKNISDDNSSHEMFSGEIQNSNGLTALLLTVERTNNHADNLSLDRSQFSNNSIRFGFSKEIANKDLPAVDILGMNTMERSQSQSAISNFKSSPKNEVSTSYNTSKITKEKDQLKYELDPAKGLETLESKPFSPESLDTPPDSWSPEIMDSGYPNSASVHDITPEYELSSIANDRISDSDSASIEEQPVQDFYEFIEVENGDLANNNRDDEGNNVIAFHANDLDDLQPLIDVLENDLENENDIYVPQNGFPLWLLRILEMANPIDLEAMGGPRPQLYPAALEQAGGDAPNVNVDNDEGFDSSSSEDDSDINDDEADDVTTSSNDETEDHSIENLARDWRAGGDP